MHGRREGTSLYNPLIILRNHTKRALFFKSLERLHILFSDSACCTGVGD